MTDNIGHVIGTGDHTEPDGSHMIQVQFNDGVREVRIHHEHIPPLLNRLQLAAMKQAQEMVHTVPYLQVSVTEFGIAHQSQRAELSVSTDQIGAILIQMTDEQIETLELEIDRLKSYRSAPPGIQ